MLIGIDWGGTKIEAVALTPEGRQIARLRADTPRHDYEGCLRTIADLVARMETDAGRQGTIGIGIPGSLEPRSRLGKGASSTWLLGRPVEADLRRALGREVRVENDADCLAASEAVDGAGAGHNVVFAVILGSGAGAGVAVGGLEGAPCYCGKHGCLETWVSGRAFQADYARHAPPETDVATLTAPAVIDRLRAGDRLAGLVWGRYVDRVARGLSLVVNALDPDIFVMGGGMSNVGQLYDDLPPVLARYTFSTVFETPIVPAAHGDSSGVRGAAWLWRDG
jgi:fructokinase